MASKVINILATCSFEAFPLPVTDCLIFLGAYSMMGIDLERAADIGSFGVSIRPGCCILSGVVITSSVQIGQGCLINPNATISHDSILEDFVELSPGANVTGNCKIGGYSFIGANAVVLPKIKIGKNAIVGAGAVVTKDVADNSVVAGVPAVVKKQNPPIEF